MVIKKTVEFLIDNGVEIKSILVTDKDENQDKISGINIEEFTPTLPEDSIVIIATGLKYQLPIRIHLFSNNIFNVICIKQ